MSQFGSMFFETLPCISSMSGFDRDFMEGCRLVPRVCLWILDKQDGDGERRQEKAQGPVQKSSIFQVSLQPDCLGRTGLRFKAHVYVGWGPSWWTRSNGRLGPGALVHKYLHCLQSSVCIYDNIV